MSETFFLSITISERARSYLAEGIAFMKREFNNLDGQIPVITFPLFWYSLDDPTKIHGSGKNGGPCVSFGSTAESSITDEIFVDVGGARVAVSLQARFRKYATLLLDYDSELTAVFQ